MPPCKLLAPSAKRAQNGAENAFSGVFVSKKTHRFTHFPWMISMKFEHKT